MNPIDIVDYQNALAAVLNCNVFNLQVKLLDPGVVAMFEETFYKVYHINDMIAFSNLFFKSKVGTRLIPPEIWLEVADEVHTERAFYKNLLYKLNEDQYGKLNLALNVSQACGNDSSAFWNTLNRLDESDLYPAAILAASETFDNSELKNDILELMIAEGEVYFNQLSVGMFETVEMKDGEVIPDETDEVGDLFYVFSVNEGCWTRVEED